MCIRDRSLTLSTIDTLINAISSLIIVNGKQINKSLSGKKIKSRANVIILFLSILVFTLASKGYSILYLFLLADLLCCAAVITIFYGFFNKKINSNLAASCIFCGLIMGLLFFPSTDFQSSILIGNLISKDIFISLPVEMATSPRNMEFPTTSNFCAGVSLPIPTEPT